MFRRFASFGMAAVAAFIATSAVAGDIEIIDAPEIDVSKSASAQGWYIRGDLGYSGWIKGDRPRLTDAGGTRDFDTARFSRPLSYGVGIGYQFSDLLRADVTADFSKDDFKGSAACAGGPCAFKADYSAAGLMANGYVDLGTLAGFTPYLGAGLGTTWLDWRNPACSGAGCPTVEGRDGLRFTYALMAGVSYDVAPHTKLDFGYRYAQIGSGDMTDFSEGDKKNGAKNAKGKDDGFGRHEFRAGLRLTTW